MGAAHAVVLLAALAGCDGEESLFVVDLKTDFVPLVEFDEIHLGVATAEGESLRSLRRGVLPGDGYVDGERVADLAELPEGTLRLRLQLFREGTLVIERPAVVEYEGRLAVTLVVTRSCRGILCPGDGDEPTATACLGGRCVDPRCTEETPGFCGEPQCTTAAECSSMVACTVPSCASGACLLTAMDSACGPAERCDPDMGCIAEAMTDGGTDGGLDAGDATPDAGPALGCVPSAEAVRVTNAGGLSERIFLARGDGELAVVWEDRRDGSSEIYFQRVSSAGALMGANVRVTDTGASSTWPTVAWDGVAYGVFWAEGTTLDFRALAPDGTPIGSVTTIATDLTSGFTPTRDHVVEGSNHATAYQSNIAGDDDVYLATTDRAGVEADRVLQMTTGPAAQSFPALAWNGSEFMVAYEERATSHVALRTVDRDVTTLGTLSVVVAMAFAPGIAFGSLGAGLAYWDRGTAEVAVQRFDAAGAPVGALARMSGSVPLIATDGRSFGVAWHTSRDGTFSGFFARIDDTGAIVGGEQRITPPGVELWPESLAISEIDGGYAVAWSDESTGDLEVYVTLLSCP